MFVKPKEGVLLRDPATQQPLPAEGANVPDTSFWHRRVRDGDVTIAEPPAEEKPAQEAPAAAVEPTQKTTKRKS